MKGFSGFKDSPVKATDAGLVNAADKMSRGLEDPTSLIGEGAIGFLEGFKKSYKPETRSQAEIKQKKEEDDKKKAENDLNKKQKKTEKEEKKERKPVIEVELPTVTEIDGKDVENKPIITKVIKKKNKKKKRK
tara:strand:- start:41 stop:439 length:399 start_codon:yes stop_codon:yes gene_type:complete